MTQTRSSVVTLGAADICSALEPVFGNVTLANWSQLRGGRGSTMLLVRLLGYAEPVVLRLRHAEGSVLGKEAALLAGLNGLVSVPRVMYADVRGSIVGVPYLVLSWVPGIPLELALARWGRSHHRALGISVGKALGRVACVRFARPGSLGECLDCEDWPDDGDGHLLTAVRRVTALERVVRRLGFRRLRLLHEFFAARKEYLVEMQLESSLVHGDFNATNVVVCERAGRMVGATIIDWEYAHSGCSLLDVGKMLRGTTHYGDFRRGLVVGYTQDAGHLPFGWAHKAEALDLLSALDSLGSDSEVEEERRRVMSVVDSALRRSNRFQMTRGQ